MDSVVTGFSNSSKSNVFNLLVGENYQVTLKKLIQEQLDRYERGDSNQSMDESDFFKLMQSQTDPPLESIWVFFESTFRGLNSQKCDSLDRASFAKDLFQFVSALAAPYSSSKSITLLAPVLFEIFTVVHEVWNMDMSSEKAKKAMREIVSLVDSIMGFVSLCCFREAYREGFGVSNELGSSFLVLVRLWIHDRCDFGKGETMKMLKYFFPLVSEEICGGLVAREFDVSYVAGVVVLEAFLLRLCLKFRAEIPKSELQKDLRTWAVGSISSCQSPYFFEVLARLLLEPTFPVNSLLNSEDELLLKKIIYDAVILVEYSFLKSERISRIPAQHMKSLILTKLFVTDEAIEIFRKNGDQTRALSYTNAFSTSSLPSQLIKWITGLFGREAKETKRNGSSAKAFIKWLVNLEGRGIKIFDGSISKLTLNRVMDVSKADPEQQHLYIDGDRNVDVSFEFYIDKKGDKENVDGDNEWGNECVSAAFVESSHKTEVDDLGRRKRKSGTGHGDKKQVKFRKYRLHETTSSARGHETPPGYGLGSDSEVENPSPGNEVGVKHSEV